MRNLLIPGIAMAIRLITTVEMPTKAAFFEIPTSLFLSSKSATPLRSSLGNVKVFDYDIKIIYPLYFYSLLTACACKEY